MKTLQKIEILHEPYVKYYDKDESITLRGLLCQCIYDDGSKEYLTNPYCVIPELKIGNNIIYIYKSKNDIRIKAEYILVYSGMVYNNKKGIFKGNVKIFEYSNNKSIRLNEVSEYTEDIIKEVLEKAKEFNINIEWKEID